MQRQDPRNIQLLFLTLFLVLGIATRDWTLRPDLIAVVTLTCLGTQWVAAILWQNFNPFSSNISFPRQKVDWRINSSLKSALITALGLSLLLRTNDYSTMILAGSLAILSKFVFQINRKHFFNPANFGIIAALILTNNAWVSPGQWGDDWWYFLLFAGTGGIILKQVGRWDTSAAFFGAYASLEALRNLWLGYTWDVYFHHLMSGSLLLFALFMLTDPRSIPNARISRLLWAVCIALFTFILQHQFFVSTAPFWALFLLSPLTVLLDYIWSAPRFTWLRTPGKQLLAASN